MFFEVHPLFSLIMSGAHFTHCLGTSLNPKVEDESPATGHSYEPVQCECVIPTTLGNALSNVVLTNRPIVYT